MKIKNLLMFVAAGAFALTSCNNDDSVTPTPQEGENFSLFLKFEGLNGETRAETNKVADQTQATLTTGILFFAKNDARGTILRKVEINNSAVPGTVTPQQLAQGKLFEDVDKEVAFVHMFGNHDFAKDPAYYVDIAEIEAEEVDVTSQTNPLTWGVEFANLYGRGAVVPAGTNPAPPVPVPAEATKEAIFEIVPLIARLEIEEFLGEGDIVSFEVEDIFVHHFYQKMAVTGALAASPNNTPWTVTGTPALGIQDWSKYHSVANSGDYLNTWQKYLYDDKMTTTPGISVTPPSGEDVWAYNVLANAGSNPHIIVRLNNIELDPSSTLPKDASNIYQNPKTGGTDAYLTIVGYTQGGAAVDVIGGNIYRLSTLKFGEDNLGETPYPGEDLEKLWVQVTVKKWNLVVVEPVFH